MSERPDGRYCFTNPDIVSKNRARQVERFNELTRQLEAVSPNSGIRLTQRGEEHASITSADQLGHLTYHAV